MKKLKELGKILTRQEMKSVSGGNPPGGGDCLYNSPNQCAPGCMYNPDGTPVTPKAYQCIPTSTGGICTYTGCAIIN
ncbi:MAG: hypothetical protein V4456_05600 [Bacteroidota bacterium]